MKQTGNYYYGARYYNPKWSTWLSVDPLAEKYASLSSYNYCTNNPIKYVDPDGRDGMVTGKGTKEDPYIVRAAYFYENGTLSEDEIGGFNDAIEGYNELGRKNEVRIKENGEKVYVKYNLTLKGVNDLDEARSNTLFETKDGEYRYYGNRVGTKPNESNDEFGSANNKRVDFNRENIALGLNNGVYHKKKLYKGIITHEIGHNLGGKHSDKTATMHNLGINIVKNQISTGSGNNTTQSVFYPMTSKEFTKIIFNRRDSAKKENSDGRLWTKKE